VRVICATNQKLEEMIAAGTFREDLYYRLSEMVINIPPLRDRIGDAEMLAQAFLQKFAEEQGKSIRGYTREALAAISGYQWPGNVRELENRVKRALIMAEGNRMPTSPSRKNHLDHNWPAFFINDGSRRMQQKYGTSNAQCTTH
jgi:two-component system NtrC family response regulator